MITEFDPAAVDPSGGTRTSLFYSPVVVFVDVTSSESVEEVTCLTVLHTVYQKFKIITNQTYFKLHTIEI